MTEKEQYFSPRELAGLPGMPTTSRAILDMAARLGWPSRKRTGRGGGNEHPLTCLPSETQAAIAGKLLEQANASSSSSRLRAGHADLRLTDAEADTLAAMYEAKSQSEKDQAAARLAVVTAYNHLRGAGISRVHALDTIGVQHQVSVATILRYLAQVKGRPEHLWLYLLTPRYCGRTVEAEMSAEAWEVLKADYLRPERPAAMACINRLRRVAEAKEWIIPSSRTLLRRLENLPKAVKVYARHGAKAAQQLYPAQQRDKSALSALQIINGDGYQHNIWVRFPDGEVIRAKTWFWQDVYSGRILTWRTDKTEHTDVIRLSFGDLVETYGIPDEALMDNTLAAANKTMSGGVKHRFRFKVREDEPLGVFILLNVRVRWATPAHGQAKPVERAYGVGGMGEIVDKAPEFSGAWTGASPLDKPDYNGKTRTIELAQLEQVIAREVAAYNAMPGRRGVIPQGRSFDETFLESYKTANIRRATEAQRRLWLLATEPVKTSAKDGAITLDAGRLQGRYANRYWSAQLVDYAGQSVVARFDPRELHSGVHVYTTDGRYICYADCFAAQGFNDQNAGREHSRARKQFVRAQRVQLTAERRMDALEAAKSLTSPEPTSIPAPALPKHTVVRGEFRRHIDSPAALPLSNADEARLHDITAELNGGRRFQKLPTDPNARYAWHAKLAAAATRGIAVPTELRGFFESYPTTSECKATAEVFREFALDIEDYAQELVLDQAEAKRAAA